MKPIAQLPLDTKNPEFAWIEFKIASFGISFSDSKYASQLCITTFSKKFPQAIGERFEHNTDYQQYTYA